MLTEGQITKIKAALLRPQRKTWSNFASWFTDVNVENATWMLHEPMWLGKARAQQNGGTELYALTQDGLFMRHPANTTHVLVWRQNQWASDIAKLYERILFLNQ